MIAAAAALALMAMGVAISYIGFEWAEESLLDRDYILITLALGIVIFGGVLFAGGVHFLWNNNPLQY